MAFVVIGAVLAVLTYGSFNKRVAAIGFVTPRDGLIVVPSDLNGFVDDIRVSEGSRVHKGEVVAVIRQDKIATNQRPVSIQLSETDRLLAEKLDEKIADEIHIAAVERNRRDERRRSIEFEISQLKDKLVFLNEKARIAEAKYEQQKQLASQGYISPIRADEERLAWQELIQAEHAARGALLKQESTLKDIALEEEGAARKSKSAIGDISRLKLEAVKQRIDQNSREQSTIVAPMDGDVTTIRIARGQATAAGAPLMSIVPSDARLEAQLFVPTSIIGHVSVGQEVHLRYRAFSFEQYGVQAGIVREVARAPVAGRDTPFPAVLPDEPLYSVRVALQPRSAPELNDAIRLQPGMLLDADILIQRVTVWRFLAGPIFQSINRK
jgi:membrane fusion protein